MPPVVPWIRARLANRPDTEHGQALVRMEVVDTLGQRTEVVFSGWKRNPAFDRGTFRFVPPAGVDVVGEG